MNSFSTSSHQITSFCLRFFFLLLISITSQFPLASHGCQEHERRALLDFKSSLSDPSDHLSSWQQGSRNGNCCRWYGIRCSPDTSHVISIDLRNRELDLYIHSYHNGITPKTALQGKLSPSLSNITNLVYLDLAWNDFQESQIPLQLSHLTKLTHLDISMSNFSASISTQFANLTSLSYLDLSCREDFSGYYISTSCLEVSSAEWLRGLENLKVLSLKGVDLSKATSSQKSFAEHISYLSHLEYLDISKCSSSSFVFPLHDSHNLSRLSTLKMNDNLELSSEIPVQMTNLTSLSILDLSLCDLHGSVPSFTQLTKLDVRNNFHLRPDLTRMFQHQWPKLQTLSISSTNVSGPIPVSISNAPLLVTFDARKCSIQGSIPSSIGNLSRLESLDLNGNNNITGTIPISICEMSSLGLLDLSNNNISGTIPSCLTKLHNLTIFDVHGNSIGGSVSLINFINELNLTTLDLGSNRLTVVVDQGFHLYSKFKLEYLVLSSCNLKGLFPAFICKLTHLVDLDLSQNHLAGVIPFNCFSELQISGSINLSNNKLDGPLPLPPLLLPLDDFEFDVSNNKFRGEISTEMGKRLSSFGSLNLAGNELSGPIPFSMFPNDSLVLSYMIDLSNNNFSGQIPFSICSKESPSKTIDLSNNKLSGIIPTSIGYCTGLFSLNLGNNNLTGNVPNELQQMIGLGYLQLNDNNLHGTPLDFISKLQNLAFLNLANNHFGGSIPSKFGSLQYLQILSLRLNNFNGSIPEKIVHLEQLQILDLSENNLTGLIPRKIGNLVMLRSRPNNASLLVNPIVDVQLQMVIKGIMIQFEKLYDYSSGIDLSCNILEGNIPDDIGLLKGLSTLNLSHNHVSGVIPKNIGNMSGLESLDLSFNKLSGNIPQSLASISSLAKLNLSYNNLGGRIPREPHFDTLSGDGSAYANNSLLCGVYTNNTCEDDQRTNAIDTDSPREGYQEDAQDKLLLYAIAALGFGVGFWGLFFVLLLKKEKWWFGYWRLVDMVAVRVADCLLKS